MTGDVFGDSLLIAENGPVQPNSGPGVRAEEESACVQGWAGRLDAVDEQLMLRVWRRLLADAGAASAILADSFLQELHGAVLQPLVVPSDTNATMLARALVESADGNHAVPFLDLVPYDGQLLRIAGAVTSVRNTPTGWAIRIIGTDESSCLVRFAKDAFLQDRPTRVTGSDVVALGVVQSAQRREIAGVALLTQVDA